MDLFSEEKILNGDIVVFRENNIFNKFLNFIGIKLSPNKFGIIVKVRDSGFYLFKNDDLNPSKTIDSSDFSTAYILRPIKKPRPSLLINALSNGFNKKLNSIQLVALTYNVIYGWIPNWKSITMEQLTCSPIFKKIYNHDTE